MNSRLTYTGFLVLMLAGLAAAPCHAQKGQQPSRGGLKTYTLRPMFYWGLGGGLNVIRFIHPDDLCERDLGGNPEDCISTPVGGGMIVFGGIRPHRFFALDLSWDFFLHTRSDVYSRATIQSLRIDVRVYFLPGLILEPYVQAGGGLYWFGDTYSWERGGGGFQAGGGFDVVWLPGFSTGLQVLYRGVYFWAKETHGGDFPGIYTGNIEATVNLTFRYFIL